VSAPMDEQPWGWRDRAKDPRLAGMGVLCLCVAVAVSLFEHGSVTAKVLVSAFVVAVGLVCGLVALPRWRDPSHGPALGGLVLAGGGVLALGVAVAVRLAA
jgi:hypothetical protein